jgi:hypothetical protein
MFLAPLADLPNLGLTLSYSTLGCQGGAGTRLTLQLFRS